MIVCVTRPTVTSTRVTEPAAATPRVSTRTRSARGSQHWVALRSPLSGLGPPRLVTYATPPSDDSAAAIGATPSGTVRSVVPESASITASASFAGNGTTTARWPLVSRCRAMAGAPAMKSPSAPDDSAGTTRSPVASPANAFSWAIARPALSGCDPGMRASVILCDSRPTEVTSARCVTASIAKPCTPDLPSNMPRAITRFSAHAK